MAASSVEIANFALSHLGVQRSIASLAEETTEAEACNLFYAQTRDEVLRDFPWPFATEIAALALVATAPNTEWGYSYRYPATAVYFRRVLNGSIRENTPENQVRTKIGRDGSGRLIFTDQQLAYAEYTVNVTDVTQFAPDYTQALALKLASYIAPRVTAGDANNLGARCMQMYLYQLEKARVNALNEEMPDLEAESYYTRIRG